MGVASLLNVLRISNFESNPNATLRLTLPAALFRNTLPFGKGGRP